MADRVYAAMDTVQAPRAKPSIDPAFGEAESAQLPPRNQPVLPTGKVRNRRVQETSLR